MSTFGFDTEEKVLSYHGPLLYEASVIDRTVRQAPDGVTKIKLYLLHYSGWNSHWDEWVPESRLLKHNPQNLRVQKERVKEFQRAHKKRKAETAGGKAKAAKQGGPSSPGGAASSAPAASGTPDEQILAEIRETLRLPYGAKLKLIEDWEHITRERKLVPLPREPAIPTILEDFMAAKARRTSHERVYGEVCDGVKAYFNQALPTTLLYKYERRQYSEKKEQHKKSEPCEYYGAEHLLRLFVKMPELLARCQMQREHMVVLTNKLAELLKFLVAQKGKYFAVEYEKVDEEYLKWWESHGGKEKPFVTN